MKKFAVLLMLLCVTYASATDHYFGDVDTTGLGYDSWKATFLTALPLLSDSDRLIQVGLSTDSLTSAVSMTEDTVTIVGNGSAITFTGATGNFLINGSTLLTMSNCAFDGAVASAGGSGTFTNCTFDGNAANTISGTILFRYYSAKSDFDFVNCSFLDSDDSRVTKISITGSDSNDAHDLHFTDCITHVRPEWTASQGYAGSVFSWIGGENRSEVGWTLDATMDTLIIDDIDWYRATEAADSTGGWIKATNATTIYLTDNTIYNWESGAGNTNAWFYCATCIPDSVARNNVFGATTHNSSRSFIETTGGSGTLNSYGNYVTSGLDQLQDYIRMNSDATLISYRDTLYSGNIKGLAPDSTSATGSSTVIRHLEMDHNFLDNERFNGGVWGDGLGSVAIYWPWNSSTLDSSKIWTFQDHAVLIGDDEYPGYYPASTDSIAYANTITECDIKNYGVSGNTRGIVDKGKNTVIKFNDLFHYGSTGGIAKVISSVGRADSIYSNEIEMRVPSTATGEHYVYADGAYADSLSSGNFFLNNYVKGEATIVFGALGGDSTYTESNNCFELTYTTFDDPGVGMASTDFTDPTSWHFFYGGAAVTNSPKYDSRFNLYRVGNYTGQEFDFYVGPNQLWPTPRYALSCWVDTLGNSGVRLPIFEMIPHNATREQLLSIELNHSLFMAEADSALADSVWIQDTVFDPADIYPANNAPR